MMNVMEHGLAADARGSTSQLVGQLALCYWTNLHPGYELGPALRDVLQANGVPENLLRLEQARQDVRQWLLSIAGPMPSPIRELVLGDAEALFGVSTRDTYPLPFPPRTRQDILAREQKRLLALVHKFGDESAPQVRQAKSVRVTQLVEAGFSESSFSLEAMREGVAASVAQEIMRAIPLHRRGILYDAVEIGVPLDQITEKLPRRAEPIESLVQRWATTDDPKTQQAVLDEIKSQPLTSEEVRSLTAVYHPSAIDPAKPQDETARVNNRKADLVLQVLASDCSPTGLTFLVERLRTTENPGHAKWLVDTLKLRTDLKQLRTSEVVGLFDTARLPAQVLRLLSMRSEWCSDPDVKRVFTASLNSADPVQRRLAAEALSSFPRSAQPWVLLIEAYAKHKDEQTRHALIVAMADLCVEPAVASLVLEALQDEQVPESIKVRIAERLSAVDLTKGEEPGTRAFMDRIRVIADQTKSEDLRTALGRAVQEYEQMVVIAGRIKGSLRFDSSSSSPGRGTVRVIKLRIANLTGRIDELQAAQKWGSSEVLDAKYKLAEIEREIASVGGSQAPPQKDMDELQEQIRLLKARIGE